MAEQQVVNERQRHADLGAKEVSIPIQPSERQLDAIKRMLSGGALNCELRYEDGYWSSLVVVDVRILRGSSDDRADVVFSARLPAPSCRPVSLAGLRFTLQPIGATAEDKPIEATVTGDGRQSFSGVPAVRCGLKVDSRE